MTRAILWIASMLGLVYCLIGQSYRDLAIPIGLASLALFVWGCARYGHEKGYSRWVGLFGILNFIGLLMVYALPTKARGTGMHRMA